MEISREMREIKEDDDIGGPPLLSLRLTSTFHTAHFQQNFNFAEFLVSLSVVVSS